MIGLLTVLLGGCGAPVPPEQPNPPPAPLLVFSEPVLVAADVELAIAVALELQRSPQQHASVLEAHALTSERWEDLLVEIASDPQASKRYAAALEAAQAVPVEASAPL